MKLATAAEAALQTANSDRDNDFNVNVDVDCNCNCERRTANGDKLSEVWYQKSINKAPAANASSAA